MDDENPQEETPQGETPQEEIPQDETPKDELTEKKKDSKQSSVKDFAKKLNANMAVSVVIALVVGMVLGQTVLPGLGVGFIAIPSPGPAPIDPTVDMAALEATIETFLNENILEPQGVEGKVESIEPYDDDFYVITLDIIKDGESLGPQELYLTRSGNAISGTVLFLDQEVPVVPAPQPQPPAGDEPANVGSIGTFTDSGDPIELVDGKPVVYLFSTTWCPHCEWIKDTFDSVMNEYVDAGKIVAYHWEVDIFDDILTEEVETAIPAEHDAVYKKFNPGGSIPTFVFGGHYYRVGNGYESQDDLEAEEAEFRAVIEALLEEAGQ